MDRESGTASEILPASQKPSAGRALIGDRGNHFLRRIEGETEANIHDMTRLLAGDDMLERIKERVKRPLTGLKVVSYYGCQMVRPPWITGFSDYENPLTLDRLAAAVGAEALDWSYKTTCCGAGIGIGRRDIQESLTARLLDKARQTDAEAIVVSCPLCQCNLDMIQADTAQAGLPVFYFTELLRLAMDPEGSFRRWFRKHVSDPIPLLEKKGLVQ